MTAFDTDVISEVSFGNVAFVARARTIPVNDQALPVPVVEELVRGRLNQIRQAESGQRHVDLVRAYELFERLLHDIKPFRLLPFDLAAETVFSRIRRQKIRIGTLDLRIAATCLAQGAKLVTRNRSDFQRIPGLDVEFWA